MGTTCILGKRAWWIEQIVEAQVRQLLSTFVMDGKRVGG